MKDKTVWEVFYKYPKDDEWMILSKYSCYEDAKQRYDDFVRRNPSHGVRIVRAETHRCVVVERTEFKND